MPGRRHLRPTSRSAVRKQILDPNEKPNDWALTWWALADVENTPVPVGEFRMAYTKRQAMYFGEVRISDWILHTFENHYRCPICWLTVCTLDICMDFWWFRSELILLLFSMGILKTVVSVGKALIIVMTYPPLQPTKYHPHLQAEQTPCDGYRRHVSTPRCIPLWRVLPWSSSPSDAWTCGRQIFLQYIRCRMD